MIVKFDKCYYPVDFVVLDTQPISNPDAQILVILGRLFLATANSKINCRTGVMQITFGNMMVDLNVFRIGKQPGDDDDVYEVNTIDTVGYTWNGLHSDPLESTLVHAGVEEHNPTAEEKEYIYWLNE